MASRQVDKWFVNSTDEEQYPPELSRLPPGRHGLPREFVVRNQHERLIAGLAEAIAEYGYADTTIARITRFAAVSRRTFYEHFDSKEECFAIAYESVVAALMERVAKGFEEGDDWPHSVKSGIREMLLFLQEEPNLARLCMVEAAAAGPGVVERYDQMIQGLIAYFETGPAGSQAERLSPIAVEAVVGGMVSLISRRVFAGKASTLELLLPDLVEFALTPYLGGVEAAQIAKSDLSVV